jgi:hypothetical protein
MFVYVRFVRRNVRIDHNILCFVFHYWPPLLANAGGPAMLKT